MKKTETKSTVLLQHHLKALKLPTVQRECEKVASRCATENVDHLAFLLQLCELELIDRERRASERRLKAAKFPTYKTLDTFDFKAQPSINKVLITELMLGEYIDQRLSRESVSPSFSEHALLLLHLLRLNSCPSRPRSQIHPKPRA